MPVKAPLEIPRSFQLWSIYDTNVQTDQLVILVNNRDKSDVQSHNIILFNV